MKTLSKFNDIEDVNVRTWNRVSVFFNTLNDLGVDHALNYIRQFDRDSKVQLKGMFDYMRKVGYEATKAAVSRGDYVPS